MVASVFFFKPNKSDEDSALWAELLVRNKRLGKQTAMAGKRATTLVTSQRYALRRVDWQFVQNSL